MFYETVHAVWEYYDRPRAGLADLNGNPHYFTNAFDEAADDYADHFELYPADPEFMIYAMRSTAIFRVWEDKFHSDLAGIDSHPGHGKIDAEYDELKAWLSSRVAQLERLQVLYIADFRLHREQTIRPPAYGPNLKSPGLQNKTPATGTGVL